MAWYYQNSCWLKRQRFHKTNRDRKLIICFFLFFIVFLISSLYFFSFILDVDSENQYAYSVKYSLVTCRAPALWDPICKGNLWIVKEMWNFFINFSFLVSVVLFQQGWWTCCQHALRTILFTGGVYPCPRMICLSVCRKQLLFYQ